MVRQTTSIGQAFDKAVHRYYEVEILTEGSIKVGWQVVGASPDHEIGCDGDSWAFDGHLEEKVNDLLCGS